MSAEDTAEERRGYSVPAAEKLLDILEFMAAQPDGLNATEIAAELGRSVHEIYRILTVLEARGYLFRRGQADGYRLSLKLFDLAHRLPSVRRLADSALNAMQDLAPKAMQSCHLGVLAGHELLIVLQVDSPLPMRYSVVLGAKFDFAEASSGTVIYAHSPDAARHRLNDWLAAQGRGDEIASILARRDDILAKGHEMRPSLAVEGVTNISAPIFDFHGNVVAALTVPYLPQRAATVPIGEVQRLTLEAARTISINLGAASGGRRDG
jgi:DNA-binding IclR family transcriptional regulator